MDEQLRRLMSGKQVEAYTKPFGWTKCVVQLCEKCKNDAFIVMMNEMKGKTSISIICPKCDTPKWTVLLSDNVTLGDTKMLDEG